MNKKMRKYIAGIAVAASCALITVSGSAMAADYDKPVFEFQKKMATNGSAKAQFFLAQMYEQGRGTRVDMEQAKYWYEQAKKNGYTANEPLSNIY